MDIAPKAKCWEYLLDGHWVVLAGKTDVDNDTLSLKLTAPDDYWFHVRGMPGSHVVLRAKEDTEPDREIIKAAAAIAAWHSKARNGGTVCVSMTRGRNVSKRRGAPAGEVVIRDETVIRVKPGLPSPLPPA